jgi:hypothetical protein
MPTVRIFGQEVERKHLLIGGGLLAAAVAVIVFLRARAGASVQATEQQQPQDAGYGGGMSVAAPSGQVADAYQQQLDNSELEAKNIANTYQKQLMTQQQTQFDFQQKMNEQLAPDILANEQSQLAVDTHYNKTVAKTRIGCPPGMAKIGNPDGSGVSCVPKNSGIPIVSDLVRSVKGLGRGVAQAAPEVGYAAAKQAGNAWIYSQLTPKDAEGVPVSASNPKPARRSVGTVPIAPTQMSGHGYEDHIG